MTKVGMLVPMVDGLVTSKAFLQDFLATVEACGVESIWTVEHVVVAEDYEPAYPYSADGLMPSGRGRVATMPDPLELLSFAAATTTTLKLGTSVVVAPLHAPAVLAKRAATIDRLSDGRLLLGLGIGWQREEYAAVGVPFEDRGRRLDECIAAMRSLWAAAPASYQGRHVSFDRVHLEPRPVGGAIPILLGGNSDAAIGRAARVGDGWVPFTLSPEAFADGAARLARSAEAAGRAPEGIEVTAWPGSFDPARDLDPELARRYVTAGAGRVLVRAALSTASGLAALPRQFDRFRDGLG